MGRGLDGYTDRDPPHDGALPRQPQKQQRGGYAPQPLESRVTRPDACDRQNGGQNDQNIGALSQMHGFRLSAWNRSLREQTSYDIPVGKTLECRLRGQNQSMGNDPRCRFFDIIRSDKLATAQPGIDASRLQQRERTSGRETER